MNNEKYMTSEEIGINPYLIINHDKMYLTLQSNLSFARLKLVILYQITINFNKISIIFIIRCPYAQFACERPFKSHFSEELIVHFMNVTKRLKQF